MTALAPIDKQAFNNDSLFLLHLLDRQLDLWVQENPNTPTTEFFGDTTLEVLEYLVEIPHKLALVPLVLPQLTLASALTAPSLSEKEKQEIEFSWLALQVIASMTSAMGSGLKSSETALRVFRSTLSTYKLLLPL